jgi:uncharacterized protein
MCMVFRICILFILTAKLSVFSVYSQVIDSVMFSEASKIDFFIGKIDTSFYGDNKIEKIFIYDSLQRRRKVISYYKYGQIESIYNFLGDDLDGVSVSFYETGALRSYSLYKNDKGFCFEYYEAGRLKEHYQAISGTYVGYRATYCSNGVLYQETFYNKPNYLSKGYHCDGSLRFEGNIVDFKEDGVWKYYNEKGKVIKKANYKNGLVINK